MKNEEWIMDKNGNKNRKKSASVKSKEEAERKR